MSTVKLPLLQNVLFFAGEKNKDEKTILLFDCMFLFSDSFLAIISVICIKFFNGDSQ